MKIVNHRLVGEGVKFLQSPNTGGLIRSMEYLIAHDDEGASMAGTESWLMQYASGVSYHALIGKKGEVTQFVDFNKRAYHAGKSSWGSLTDLNWYTIGVSMQNRNKEPYTEKQIEKFIEVGKLIYDTYSLKDILGHKQISPGRKNDPHAGFPWARIKAGIQGGTVLDTVAKAVVTASKLNVRTGPGVRSKIATQVSKNDEVHILSETPEGWAEVIVCKTGVKGWVSKQYLKQ